MKSLFNRLRRKPLSDVSSYSTNYMKLASDPKADIFVYMDTESRIGEEYLTEYKVNYEVVEELALDDWFYKWPYGREGLILRIIFIKRWYRSRFLKAMKALEKRMCTRSRGYTFACARNLNKA